MNSSQRVAKNTAWMLVAGGLGAVLQMLAVLLAARGLPLGDFGIFNYLLSFATVFQFLADFGLTNILVREVARQPDKVGHLLASAKGLMWALFLCSTAILLGVVLVINLPLRTQEQSFVMGIASLTLLQAISYSAVLRAIEAMEFNAIGFTLHKAFFAGFVGLSLFITPWFVGCRLFAAGRQSLFLVFQLANCELARRSSLTPNRFRPLEAHAFRSGASR